MVLCGATVHSIQPFFWRDSFWNLVHIRLLSNGLNRCFFQPQISTNFHKLFFVESCWICVSFGNRSTRSTRSTRICPTTFLPTSVRFIIFKSKISEICGICVSQGHAPRPFHQPPWDLTSSKAKSVRSVGSVWAKPMPHDHSINLREIYHHQKPNQWDLRDLCEL